jgi:hypothetical protein
VAPWKNLSKNEKPPSLPFGSPPEQKQTLRFLLAIHHPENNALPSIAQEEGAIF